MNQSGRPLTVAVLGGAGPMGRIAVKDLIETTPLGTEVLIADYNPPAQEGGAGDGSNGGERGILTAEKVSFKYRLRPQRPTVGSLLPTQKRR
jgi:hypothetical protein